MLCEAKAEQEGQQAAHELSRELLLWGGEAMGSIPDHLRCKECESAPTDQQRCEMPCGTLHAEALGTAQAASLTKFGICRNKGLRQAAC